MAWAVIPEPDPFALKSDSFSQNLEKFSIRLIQTGQIQANEWIEIPVLWSMFDHLPSPRAGKQGFGRRYGWFRANPVETLRFARGEL
jgi:hypothetical protein